MIKNIVFFYMKTLFTFTNSVDPDETPHYAAFHDETPDYAAFHMGLHFL